MWPISIDTKATAFLKLRPSAELILARNICIPSEVLKCGTRCNIDFSMKIGYIVDKLPIYSAGDTLSCQPIQIPIIQRCWSNGTYQNEDVVDYPNTWLAALLCGGSS
jgi:hypothetical protein